MKLVVQRVRSAWVRVEDREVARIERGLLVLVGVGCGDTEADADFLAGKTSRLRIFDDEAGRMNRSVAEVAGGILAVSQFTLFGDCRKGNRPSYITAAEPEMARALYERYVASLTALGHNVQTGCFRENMLVGLENDGPVTLLLESKEATKS